MARFPRILFPCALAAAIAGDAIAAQNTMTPQPSQPATAPAPRPMTPPRMTSFMMSGLSFGFPLPDGFCIPAGRYATHARQVADGDAANQTSLSFSDCGSMARNANLSRWGMIKTPRNLVYQDVGTRVAVIAELKRQFDSGEFQRQMNQGIANAAGNEQFATTAKPLGTDAYGAYVGGTLTMDGRTMAAAWGMTAVKRRLFAIYFYGPYSGPADVQDVVNRARNATRALVHANPGN
jgi:hypothetical protein